MACLIITHIDAVVSGDADLLKNNSYGRQLDLAGRVFDEDQICKLVGSFNRDGQEAPWELDPNALWRHFQKVTEKMETNQDTPMAKTAVS